MNVLIAADMEGVAGVEVRPIADLALVEAEPSLTKANGGSLVYAQGLAAEGIPVLAATGDRWMLEELGAGELGTASLVATKEGLGRGRARSHDPAATHAEPAELLTEIATVFRTSKVSREYRQLAKLLPSEHGSRPRALRRRLGSLLATPVMRAKERRWLAGSPSA